MNDLVEWTYLHHLNSRSSKYRTKVGTFIRHVKTSDGKLRSAVLFNGNKTVSIVPTNKLRYSL